MTKEHINKLHFRGMPMFLQGASPSASFPLKQWMVVLTMNLQIVLITYLAQYAINFLPFQLCY